MRKEDNKAALSGILPVDSSDMNHLRFAINFFTAIELPELAEHLHEQLKMHSQERDVIHDRLRNAPPMHDSESEGLVSDGEDEGEERRGM